MDIKILQKLRSNMDYMSAVEKRIAKVILEDTRAFVSYPLSETAARAEVSQGSVVNFATKYTSGGYAHLKLCVAASLAEESVPFSVVEEGDSIADALRKTVRDIGTALENTQALCDTERLLSVAEHLLAAKKVEIYGIYRSGVVANDLYYRLLQIGIAANYVSDVLTCAVSASLLSEESLVFAVSSSGKTQDVIDAVRLAKQNGAYVVALTARGDSPLACLADEVLIACASGNSLFASATEIRMSQLALIDTLCSYIEKQLGPLGKERHERAGKILNMHNVKE